MTVQGCLLFAYRCLLWLYPAGFRRRFAAEMVELAEAAEAGEWPLIFSDTSVGVVRSWLQTAKDGATVVGAEPDGYLALGESPLPALRIVQGFVLSAGIILGACYISSVPSLWRFPDYPNCKAISAKNARPAKDTSIRALRHQENGRTDIAAGR